MSAQLSPSQAALLRLLGPLEGMEIPGGCDDCDAYQSVVPVAPGVWSFGVYHDDDCPTLARMQGRAA